MPRVMPHFKATLVSSTMKSAVLDAQLRGYEHLDSLWILREIKSVSFNSLCASFTVTKVKLTVREASLIALLAPKVLYVCIVLCCY